MSSPRPESGADPRVLFWIPALSASVMAFVVFQTWAARLTHPFDLEWMEGGMLAHAWRVQRGLPLYPEASADWLPYVYPPGYTLLLATFGWVNLDYPVGRALSVAGTLLATGCLVWGIGRRATWPLGLACGGIFLGCYRASGAFYDLVRPDAVAMGLLAAAITVGVERWRRAPEAAGLLLFLAFTVKHHAAMFGFAFLAAYLARGGWREAARFVAASAVPGLLFTLGMQLGSGGHFLDWLLGVPASHPMVGARIVPGTLIELGKHLGGPLVLIAIALLSGATRWGALLGGLLGAAVGGFEFAFDPPEGIDEAPTVVGVVAGAAVGVGGGAWLAGVFCRRPDWRLVFAGAFALVGLGVAAVMRGHNGGFVNVFMPVHWLISAGAGYAAIALWRVRPGWPTAGVLSALLTLHLGLQVSLFEQKKLVPTQEDVNAGNALIAELRARCDGEILSPFAAWLPVRVGRAPSWHLIAWWDIDHKTGPFYRTGMPSVAAAARSHRWACVVDSSKSIGGPFRNSYTTELRFSLPGKALSPKTGWRVRPTALLVPDGDSL